MPDNSSNLVGNVYLTDEYINAISESMESARKEAIDNGAIDIEKIKEEVVANANAELEHEIVETNMNASDIVSSTVETMPVSNISLLDIGDTEAEEKSVNERALEEAKDNYEMSDEEVGNMLEIFSRFRSDPSYPVYKNLPEVLKKMVRDMAFTYNIPSNQWNDIARMIVNEMLNDAKMKEALIDFEKSLDEALKMPSITDVYSEHTREVMEVRIPEMIEKIKDEEPEKAAMLDGVRQMFTKSYDFSLAREEYLKNTRLRKALRRYDMEFKRTLDNFNFLNSKSKFRMNDVRELPEVLTKVLMEDDLILTDENGDKIDGDHPLFHMTFSDTDIKKFCILICKSCENMNPDDIVQASYMYYMMRNIIALKTSTEAKTPFAAELISNICETIAFIRDKEAEFNADHSTDKLKRKHKSNSNRN